MSRATTIRKRDLSQWEPTWEAGEVIPHQGSWTEEEYLSLTTNHLVEYSDGFLEIPPVPTMSHQKLVVYMLGLLTAFVSARDLGTVLLMGLRVRLWPRKICEPDVVFMAKEHADRMGEDCWDGADLAMEVVSGSSKDRRRDLVVKRKDYARAGIAEYWIVDPREELITVLRLRGKDYVVHGEFGKGTAATSHLLKGFEVDVTKAFAQQVRPTTAKAARNGKRKPKE
jgi:Uma2 family endonuclease